MVNLIGNIFQLFTTIQNEMEKLLSYFSPFLEINPQIQLYPKLQIVWLFFRDVKSITLVILLPG